MNMNSKKVILLLSLFTFSLLIFNIIDVNATTTTTTQVAEYVAENPCDENSIRSVMRLFGYILLVVRIAVPLIIIGFGTLDLAKAVIDKDDKSLTKQMKQLGIRVLAGLIVFFVPNIVALIFSMSDKLNILDDSQYKTCANCLLKPNSCDVNSGN